MGLFDHHLWHGASRGPAPVHAFGGRATPVGCIEGCARPAESDPRRLPPAD